MTPNTAVNRDAQTAGFAACLAARYLQRYGRDADLEVIAHPGNNQENRWISPPKVSPRLPRALRLR